MIFRDTEAFQENTPTKTAGKKKARLEPQYPLFRCRVAPFSNGTCAFQEHNFPTAPRMIKVENTLDIGMIKVESFRSLVIPIVCVCVSNLLCIFCVCICIHIYIYIHTITHHMYVYVCIYIIIDIPIAIIIQRDMRVPGAHSPPWYCTFSCANMYILYV